MIVSLIKLSSLIKKVIFQCIADFVTVPFQPNDIFFNTLHLLHSIRNSVFPPFFSFFLSQVINLYLYQFVLFPRLFSF